MRTVIEMAREAGFSEWAVKTPRDLEHFAELVRANERDRAMRENAYVLAEREACALLVESRKTGANELMDTVRDMEAAAIRARGNT